MAYLCPRKAFSKCRNCDQNHHTLLCVRPPRSHAYVRNAPPNNYNPDVSTFEPKGNNTKDED